MSLGRYMVDAVVLEGRSLAAASKSRTRSRMEVSGGLSA